MKKLLTLIFVFAITFVLISQPVFAGGGQVVGENGEGEVAQNGPCPFGGDTPAGPQN